MGRPAQTRPSSNGTSPTACGSSIRWPSGATGMFGGSSRSTTCPTTRCTTAATSRSGARRAPIPAPAARAAGRGRTRPSAACTARLKRAPMDPLIIVFGLGVGVLIGMTGIGGGSLMTPLLIIFAGIQPTVAIGTDLAYGAVTKTVGGWRHWRNHTVDFGVCWWLAAGSVPGAVIGVWLLDRLHSALGGDYEQVLLSCVAAALTIA